MILKNLLSLPYSLIPLQIFFGTQLHLILYLIYFSAPLSFVILFYIFRIITNMVDVHISIGNITIIVYY